MLGLVVAAALVAGFGLEARGASAQTASVTTGGPYSAVVNQPVTLTGTAYSSGLAAAIWSFSDGTSLSGLSVVKTFATSGLFTATLTVTDLYGYTYSNSTTVTVSDQSVLNLPPFWPQTMLIPQPVWPQPVLIPQMIWPQPVLNVPAVWPQVPAPVIAPPPAPSPPPAASCPDPTMTSQGTMLCTNPVPPDPAGLVVR
jgi:PKD repeat protein